ncbi:hypothetical protein TIFTF001_004283 [Ficus carica]|uniref:Uncharacterized protein n=1 Tax=Ficus carica TaxID=3494 RepID=A0AA87ZIQ6_FICCA|nr:hypothetical protein TIFTF001_004283 [Ficus carica]
MIGSMISARMELEGSRWVFLDQILPDKLLTVWDPTMPWWSDNSLCALNDCLSIDNNIPSIVDVFSKRALYMLDYRIAEEFEKIPITGVSTYAILTKLH